MADMVWMWGKEEGEEGGGKGNKEYIVWMRLNTPSIQSKFVLQTRQYSFLVDDYQHG